MVSLFFFFILFFIKQSHKVKPTTTWLQIQKYILQNWTDTPSLILKSAWNRTKSVDLSQPIPITINLIIPQPPVNNQDWKLYWPNLCS